MTKPKNLITREKALELALEAVGSLRVIRPIRRDFTLDLFGRKQKKLEYINRHIWNRVSGYNKAKQEIRTALKSAFGEGKKPNFDSQDLYEARIVKRAFLEEQAERNPSGYCDHLHYPESCDICSGGYRLLEKQVGRWEIELRSLAKIKGKWYVALLKGGSRPLNNYIRQLLKSELAKARKEAVGETLEICEEAAENALSLIMSELSGCDPTAEYLGEQVDTFKDYIGLTELRTEYGLDSEEGGDE